MRKIHFGGATDVGPFGNVIVTNKISGPFKQLPISPYIAHDRLVFMGCIDVDEPGPNSQTRKNNGSVLAGLRERNNQVLHPSTHDIGKNCS